MRTVHFPANKTVFRKDDPGDTMMIVVSGRMKITTTSMDGSEMIINTILPGEVVGEIALLDGQERTADAVTAEETEALVIRRDDFALLLKDSAELCLSVIDLLVRQAAPDYRAGRGRSSWSFPSGCSSACRPTARPTRIRNRRAACGSSTASPSRAWPTNWA